MKWILKTIVTIFIVFPLSLSATERPAPAFDITSVGSVDEAVSIITTILQKQHFEILGVINHAENASNVGLELEPTQLILFRNRHHEKKLTRRSTTVAIDLPFKILVYKNAAADIKLKSNDIGYLISRHNIPIRESRLRHLDNALDQFGLNQNGLVQVKSTQSVDATIAKLRTVLKTAGFFIPFELNFNKHNKHSSHATLLIFGNPNVGTLLMQNQQEIGLDLPQKFLVYEDHQGETYVVYNQPHFIAQRAGIQGLDNLLNNIATALANFAQMGAQP